MSEAVEYPIAGGELTAHLSAARDGSSAALGRLLDSQRDYLLLIASEELVRGPGLTLSPSDVVQWTAMEAVRDFRRFHGQTAGDFRYWLRRILLNNLADHRRRAQVPRAPLSADAAVDDRTPGQLLLAIEDSEALHALILALPDDERQVIQLRYFERKSHAEIAHVIGRTPEATRKLWARAIVRLQARAKTQQGLP